jgi:hypothetical protein|tara:strand:- start:116324 stop:116455 length:132 start_codon:yes stop_codon:yes gene_type:complete
MSRATGLAFPEAGSVSAPVKHVETFFSSLFLEKIGENTHIKLQ